MKKLLFMIIIAIAIVSCKKEDTVQPQQQIQIIDYTGTYEKVDSLCTGFGQRHEIIVTNNGGVYSFSEVNSAVGINIVFQINGSAITIAKAGYTPKVNNTIEGSGSFTNTHMTLDYTTISANHMEDYVCHGVYKKL